jgi:hypothetical protein
MTHPPKKRMVPQQGKKMSKTYVYVWCLFAWSQWAWGVIQLEIATGKRWMETSSRSNEKFGFTGQETSGALRLAPLSGWPVSMGLSYAFLELNPMDFTGTYTTAEMKEIGSELSFWLPFFDRAVPFFTMQILMDAHLQLRSHEASTPSVESRIRGGRAFVGMRYRVLPISSISISAFQGMYQVNEIESEKRSLNSIGVLAGFDVFL